MYRSVLPLSDLRKEHMSKIQLELDGFSNPLQGWAKPAQGPIDVVDLKVGADITIATEPEPQRQPSGGAPVAASGDATAGQGECTAMYTKPLRT